MRQFKTLQRIFSDDVKLNKSNRLTFKFEIENTKLVDSIKLEISIKMIIFYIVETNISFLLSLAVGDNSYLPGPALLAGTPYPI